MKMKFLLVLALIWVLGGYQEAAAWQEGVPYDELCEDFPLAGADRVVVRVTPKSGSFGLPILVGLKEEAILWQHEFPNVEEVNVAKFFALCSDQEIDIRFSYPASTISISQKFKWDGASLIKLSTENINQHDE